MARRGGFSPSLDPFGTSRGGLGRYNITGDTISSLAQTEAYAVYVAWSNGAATDEEYLASLSKLVDLETPGTSGYLSAKNKLDDATYSIGRNKFVEQVNNATSTTDRVAALKAMLAYDQAHLGTMTAKDSQAYRDQQDRVASTRVNIRQAQYADLVDKVNRGKGTTQQLIDMATRLEKEAGSDPDAADWQKALGELHDRKADENLADGYQAYQHHRLSGAKLLAQVDARLGELTPNSPAWKQLNNQREDLVQNIKDQERAKAEATFQGQVASGKLSDQARLAYLKKAYEAETPGTADAIQAGNRLRDFTFSLAEDKLRFDVVHHKRPVSDLIRFYTAYQHGMNPGSERWRQLQTAIDSLKGGRGIGGGGGGGGGGGKGKNVGTVGKILGGPSVLADFLGGGGHGTKPVPAPKDFADLFRVDITSTAAKHWWDNNLRSMTDSFQAGRGSWTYYDKRGGAHELPFTPQLMNEMDALNLGYNRRGLASARTAKEAQTWVGRIITATKQGQAHGATYTMDVYSHAFADLEKSKAMALAGGRYAEYANLVRQQSDLARLVLGVADGAQLDINNATNPYLTLDQKQRIENDLAKIAPKNTDQESPFYNPSGDPVLGLMRDGSITTSVDPSTGDISRAALDPNKGYVTQAPDGSVQLVEVPDPSVDPTAWRYNEATGETVPRYRDDNLHVTVRMDGQDVEVWQPINKPDDANGVAAGVSVWKIDPGSPGAAAPPSILPNPFAPQVGIAARPPSLTQLQDRANGRAATLSLLTTYTRESSTVYDPKTGLTHTTSQIVAWVSTDGETWYRKPSASGLQPRLVLNNDGVVTLGDDGKWKIGGKDATPDQVLAHTHIWDGSDANATGTAADKTWGVGAPGATFDVRVRGANGSIDMRPAYILQSEEDAAQRDRLIARSRNAPINYPNGPAGNRTPQDLGPGYGPQDKTGVPGPVGGRNGISSPSKNGLSSMGDLLPPFLRNAIGGLNNALGQKPVPLDTLLPPKVPTLGPPTPVQFKELGGRAKIPELAPVAKPILAPVSPMKPYGGSSSAKTGKDDTYVPPKKPPVTPLPKPKPTPPPAGKGSKTGGFAV